MARNRQPVLKRCKALGIEPSVMGYEKSTKRNPKPNRRKMTEYGLQLREKQKVKFIYGVLEKQFEHYFEVAERKPGQTGELMLQFCECRLDNVVFRMGLAKTRREARQLVVHNHYTVNGKKVNIPSYQIKVGDVIALDEKSRQSDKFKSIVDARGAIPVVSWLDYDKEKFEAKVTRLPIRDDIDFDVEETMIVELYSK